MSIQQDVACSAVPTAKPLVSIVIVSYNGLEVLRPCLESLRALTYPRADVVVVDNGSDDGTADFVTSSFPAVQFIRLAENTGFARGNNIGIKHATGEFVFILNNDAEVSSEVIDELIRFMEEHPDVGMVCPKVVKYDEPSQVDSLGLATYRDGMPRGLGRGESAALHRGAIEILFPSGCACLCRREVLEDVGLFDEDFYLLLEDADLGWRVRMAGWRCFCVPTAVVRHRYSTTIGPYSMMKAYYVERNRIWVAIKNFPLRHLWKCPYYTLVRYAHQAWAVGRGEGASACFYKRYGPWVLAWTMMRAYIDAARGLPTMLRKRRELAHARTGSAKEIVDLFDRYGMSARQLAQTT